QHGRQRGDTDGAAEVAQYVVEAGGRAGLDWRQPRGGDDGQRHHDHGLPAGADDLDGNELVAAEVQAERAAEKAAGTEQRQAYRANQPGIDVAHQHRDQWDQQQLGHPHPHDHLADLQGVVTLDLRQVQRQDEYRTVQAHPQPDVGQAAEQEVALLEQSQVDQMVIPGQLQDHEDAQADEGDGGQQDDFPGLEPVLPLPLLKKYLQTTQADGHAQDARVVTLLQQLPAWFALVQTVQQPEGHQRAGHNVNVEDPFPAVVFRQPAADGGADGGREGSGDGEHRHALGPDIQRQLGQHQGEGEGNQRAPGQALQYPEQDHALEVPGHGAEQRGQHEENRDGDCEAARRHDHGEPGRQRDDNDLGNQVGGRDPGAFLDGCRERALDILERGVDDLDIKDRHEGAEDGAENGNPVAARWRGDRLRLGQGRFSHAGRP